MGKQNPLSFIDALSVASFLIGLENLDMNITQEDVQEISTRFNRKLESSIKDIHNHLELQDKKLNIILDILHENGGVINGD